MFPVPLLHPSKQLFRQLLGRLHIDQSGLALIEFAYILPFLILLTFGGVELANTAITYARVSSITSTVADGVARVRDRIDENDINDVITGAKFSAEGLDLTSGGRIIISTVEDNAATVTPTTDQVITWQRCKGMKNVASSIGAQGAVLTSPIGAAGAQLLATPGNAVVIVEIIYDYRPIFSDMFFGTRTIRYRSAFSVRDRTLQTLQNGQGLATAAKATCNYLTA